VSARSLQLAVLASACGFACSLFLHFEPEGQPCDGFGECLHGYACVDGGCLRVPDACGGCPAGQRCRGAGCIEDTCANRLCPVGQTCELDSQGTRCRAIPPPALLHGCASDADCETGRLCLIGSVPSAGGAPRTGVCVEPCAPGGTCASSSATCRTFQFASDAGSRSLCLPTGAVLECQTDGPCLNEGFVCAVFGHPALDPIGLCDAPLPGGAAKGLSCGPTTLCASGLCAGGTCGELCTGTCSGGAQCASAELEVPAGGPARHVPMCLPALTHCASCSAGTSACGADAPHCTYYGARQVCLSSCAAPDAGTQDCPVGTTCAVLPEGPRCVPLSGACP
jgi:hypothetical protein